MTDWTDIGALTDIPERGARVVKTHLGCVAVFRTVNDEVFAIDDACPHKGGPLSEGIVHGRSVTCPLHNMVLRLFAWRRAGSCWTPHACAAGKWRDGRRAEGAGNTHHLCLLRGGLRCPGPA